MLGVVQTVTHHKGVGDGEAGVVDLHRLDPAVRLIQQGAQADGGGAPLLQHPQQVAQSVARVQNILHQEDVLALDVAGQVLGDLDLAAGGAAGAVGGHRHKVHGTGQVDPAAQVRHKDEGAPQDADEHNFPALVVLGDLDST